MKQSNANFKAMEFRCWHGMVNNDCLYLEDIKQKNNQTHYSDHCEQKPFTLHKPKHITKPRFHDYLFYNTMDWSNPVPYA